MGRFDQQPQEREAPGILFFKVLVEGFASKMCLPPAVARYITVEESANAIINNSVTGSWTVKVHRSNNSLVFKTGWPEFVKCHKLQYGDFLVFKYNGDLNFDIRVFGRSGSEQVIPHVPRSGRLYKIQEETEEIYGSSNVYFTGSQVLDGARQDGSNYQQILSRQNPVGISKRYISRRKNVTMEERKRALAAARSLNLSQPHLVANMTKTNVSGKSGLNVPKSFLRAFPLKHGSIITLHDPAGKLWEVGFSAYDDGGKLSRGWSAFTADHDLQKGDICVFELIERNGAVMKVHIFRVQDIIPPCKRRKH